jgi:hypothetical protein
LTRFGSGSTGADINGGASLRRADGLQQSGPTEAPILGEQGLPPFSARPAGDKPLPSFIWPNPKRARVGPAGAFGRVIHWLGLIAALLCALMAVEFLVEGWARPLSYDLLATAAALTLGTRAVRYVLARE